SRRAPACPCRSPCRAPSARSPGPAPGPASCRPAAPAGPRLPRPVPAPGRRVVAQTWVLLAGVVRGPSPVIAEDFAAGWRHAGGPRRGEDAGGNPLDAAVAQQHLDRAAAQRLRDGPVALADGRPHLEGLALDGDELGDARVVAVVELLGEAVGGENLVK